MLNLGNFRAGSCSGISRRAFVQLGASLPAVLGVAGLPVTIEAAMKGRAKSIQYAMPLRPRIHQLRNR